MTSTAKPTKRQRRLGIRVLPKLDKYVARRPYPPGIHGGKRPQALSDYGLQLQEKQRVKFIYGLRERQLQRLFEINPQSPLTTLESRVDNVVYRAGLAASRPQARQMVSHGHFLLNAKKINIPSTLVKTGQQIAPKNPDKIKLQEREIPSWLELDKKSKSIRVKKLPQRDDITSEINEQLVIEYYSR